MKLKQTTTAVETNNVTEGNTFGIKSSPKTFAILSSGLYSDKIAAVVRELSCNAYDSHVDRNKLIDQGRATRHTAPRDTNIRVHFPTHFDPFFSVRDFGIGLTPEEVESIYTVYFESTKQDSNDYIGALGLGSKSPFSYAQSFNVIATKNGHRVVYTMFMNSQGIPQPAKLDEGPVESFYMDDEEIPKEEFYDGVEVKVPAEPGDARSFFTAAERVYRFFEVCPELYNYDGSEIIFYKNRDSVEEFIDGVYIGGDGWNAKQYAIQGNVAYPIQLSENDFNRAVRDIDKFVDENESGQYQFTDAEIERLYKFYRSVFCEYTVYVKFNIGDLDVAASREELSYDASTIMAILLQIKRIADMIEHKFNEHMEKFETKWDKARELMRIGGDQYGVTERNSLDRLYRKTNACIDYLDYENIPQLKVTESYGGSKHLVYASKYSSLPVPEETDFSIRLCGRQTTRRFFRVYHNTESPQKVHGFVDNHSIPALQESILIVVNDTKRGGATLAKAYFQQESSKSYCMLLEPHKFGEIDGIKDYIETNELKMDNPELKVVYLSDVKEAHPELLKRNTAKKSNYGFYSLTDSFASVSYINESIPEDFDEEDEIIYIPFKQQKPFGGDIDFDKFEGIVDKKPETIGDIVVALRKIETVTNKSLRVIGLNQNMLRQVKDYENWVSIEDFVVEQLQDLFGTEAKRKAIEKTIDKKREENDIHDCVHLPFCQRSLESIYHKAKGINGLHDLASLLKVLKTIPAGYTEKESLLMDFFEISEYKSTKVELIDKKYPMLLLMRSEYSWEQLKDNELESVINYCMMCNQGESK